VYEVAQIAGQFDYVFFMGVFYHLRYPAFALDQVVKKIRPEGRLVFQSMLRGSDEVKPWKENYLFWETNMFADPAFPAMHFVEHSYSNDQTNWWIPNRAAAEAVLRSSGLEILEHPESETWICVPRETMRNGEYILDLELKGKL
jgi:tRNA (mo5U34)-methyltransferase